MRILIIEDDPAIAANLYDYFEAKGHFADTAADGVSGLHLAVTGGFDVIVLDLGLPDTDGWEVARRLKASPRTAAVPIIALTGASLPHERVSAMRAGCDRYLIKPCRPPDLLQAIRQCLEKE